MRSIPKENTEVPEALRALYRAVEAAIDPSEGRLMKMTASCGGNKMSMGVSLLPPDAAKSNQSVVLLLCNYPLQDPSAGGPSGAQGPA